MLDVARFCWTVLGWLPGSRRCCQDRNAHGLSTISRRPQPTASRSGRDLAYASHHPFFSVRARIAYRPIDLAVRSRTSNRLATALYGPTSRYLGAAVEVGDTASRACPDRSCPVAFLGLPVLLGRALLRLASEAREARTPSWKPGHGPRRPWTGQPCGAP